MNHFPAEALGAATQGGMKVSQQMSVAIVGGGPMALYALKHLSRSQTPIRIVLFERAAIAGPGMPYNTEQNADFMLSNIFSREIPELSNPLSQWLREQPSETLARWSIDPAEVSSRAFYSRTVLGAYLAAQMNALGERAIAAGHSVEILARHDVIDVVPLCDHVMVHVVTPQGPRQMRCDQVLLATGHVWPEPPKIGEATLLSPWPARVLAQLPAGRLAILGSSLSAVDVAVALAHAHGEFRETSDGLAWRARQGHDGLHITMVSRNGVLPEADFHYPYPYEPLQHLTDEAVKGMIDAGQRGILDATFALLIRELGTCDPEYLHDLAMPEPTLEAFGEAYFARRLRLGAFRALRQNLRESRKTMERRETVEWRYALLRGHAVFETAMPAFTPDDWNRFRRHLLPVFADCYAAVPHLSLDRICALHDAGVIDILPTDDDTGFTGRSGQEITVRGPDGDLHFLHMIDARGQEPALPAELPFPSLVDALATPGQPLMAPFRLKLRTGPDRVVCLSMPQLLERHPFSQGLPNCDDLAQTGVAEVLGWGAAHDLPTGPKALSLGAA